MIAPHSLRTVAGWILFPLAVFHAGEAPAPGSGEDVEPPRRAAFVETVEVHAARLPAEATAAERLPAHVTVIDRERIDRSGARTLQQLLAREAGVVVYDQVGNDVEQRLDLRGFADGTATRVYLDGAPLNDTRNNELALHLLPLEAVERIEIVRGAAANAAGGGAEAGVIHLFSRAIEGLGGAVSAAVGSDATRQLSGGVTGRRGRVSLGIWGGDEETDGFRENAGGDLRRLAGRLAVELPGAREVGLSVVDSRGALGHPGALTESELRLDRSRSPFNRLDFADRRLRQAALNFRGPLGQRGELAANLFGRGQQARILSTGRAAATFGGFFLDSDESVVGADVQLTRRLGGKRTPEHELIAGVEWLTGETDALGYFTPPGDPALVDRAAPASDNTTERRTSAVYLQHRFRPVARWTLMSAVRVDRDRLGYRETLPDPTLADARTFSELSLRAGATWSPGTRHSVWTAYGQSHLPPTVEQLFAFPLFGSNPELRPQESASWELGWRLRLPQGRALDLTLLRVDTVDEIVFVLSAPDDFLGRNENAGKTRRQGLEAAFRGRAGTRVELFANLTLLDAEFRTGPDRGSDVPLVPQRRLAVGVDTELAPRVALRAELLHVGEQVLDNDAGNREARLDDYTVLDVRVRWFVGPRATADAAADGLSLFAEVRNLLDRDYATRGIRAFDFAAGADAVFLTPAPGRRLFAGVAWRF